jgi:hypothetical protein
MRRRFKIELKEGFMNWDQMEESKLLGDEAGAGVDRSFISP